MNKAKNASRLIERWKTGILDDVESTIQRLSHIIEGPNGLLRKINAIEYASDSPLNSSNQIKSNTELEVKNFSKKNFILIMTCVKKLFFFCFKKSGVSSVIVTKVRSLSNRVRDR